MGEFSGTVRFAPVRRLGAGGMGVVFEVFDRDRDEHVALKTLRHVSAQSLYYLKQEFRALQGVHHPNLVRLHELIESGGHWFFTMELVRGRDFLSYVRGTTRKLSDAPADTQIQVVSSRQDVASPRVTRGSGALAASDHAKVRKGLLGVLDGLAALHDTGMIHRDIKPSNVMVTERERVVLLDFGLTRAVAGREPLDGEAQRMMGTPGYMSPEQYGSAELTAASDLYSVGATLYEALTGHLPHSGPIAEIMKACEQPPRPPSELVPDVPADLDELCMSLLRYRPDDRPSVDEARRMLDDRPRGAPPRRVATSLPHAATGGGFVGRSGELDELESLFERVRSGSPVSVLVEGASGIGKTALVRQFLRRVEAGGGATVLMGRCYESESVPYKALDSLVDDLGGYLRGLPPDVTAELVPDHAAALVRLFPVLDQGAFASTAGAPDRDPAELRSQAFSALKQLLRRLGRRGPLVVFIDDLQWGDADSGALLRELLRPPGAPTMLFVATYRAEAADDPLIVSLAGEHRRLRLEPLSAAEARALVDGLAGERRGHLERWLDEIVREGKGSPYLIGEIVRHLSTRPGGDFGGDGAAEGALLRRVIGERIASLPADAARTLRAAAVIGRPVSRQLLCDVVSLDTAQGRRTLDLLVAANMLRIDREDDVGVYHDRLREAVVAELSPREIRDTYRAMHGALERSGSDARHAELLGLSYIAESDPERALEYAVRAAALAENAVAFGRAARLYELALTLAPGPARRPLLRRYAQVLHDGGYGADAAKVYLELAEGAPADRAVELTRRAADDLLRSGHIEQGLARLGDVARQLGVKLGRSRVRTAVGIAVNRARLRMRGMDYEPRSEAECPPRELARVDSLFAGATALGIVDHLNGALMQTEHLLSALALGEERRVWRAIAAEVVFLSAQGGRAARRAELLRSELERRADELDDAYLRAGAKLGAGYLALFGSRYAEAHAGFDAAIRELRACPDAWWERSTAQYWDLLTLVTMGDYNGVAELLPRLIHTAEERNDRYLRSALRSHAMVMHMLRADRADDIDAELDAALEGWPQGRQYVAHYTVMISRVAVRLYQRRPREALDILRSAKSLMRRLLVHRVPFAKSEVDKLTALGWIGLGDWRRARRAIRALEGFGVPMSRAYGAMYRAPFALERGDRDEAVRLVEAAISLFEQCGARHDAAAARYRAGRLIGGPQGDALVHGAREWFDAQGVVNVDRMIDYLAPGYPPDGAA